MRRPAILLLTAAVGLLSLAGCDPRQMLFFLQPFDPQIKAPGPSLKGKKVVIITKTVPGTQSDFVSLDRNLTRELTALLRKDVHKLEIVDVDKVQAWDRAHPSWTDPADAGAAFDADLVIFLEIAHFQIQSPSSPELFEGKSNIHVRVVEFAHPKDDRDRPMTDKPKESSVVYDNDRETIFPIRGPVPVSAGVNAATFKNRFLKVVATELSWDFIPHAAGDNIQDVKFNDD
jgi:hypothetical protein